MASIFSEFAMTLRMIFLPYFTMDNKVFVCIYSVLKKFGLFATGSNFSYSNCKADWNCEITIGCSVSRLGGGTTVILAHVLNPCRNIFRILSEYLEFLLLVGNRHMDFTLSRLSYEYMTTFCILKVQFLIPTPHTMLSSAPLHTYPPLIILVRLSHPPLQYPLLDMSIGN